MLSAIRGIDGGIAVASMAPRPMDRHALANMVRKYAVLPHPDKPDARPPYGPGEWLFDLRSVTLFPEVLDFVAEEFWRQYAASLPFQVAGLELGAVPIVGAILQKAHTLGIETNGLVIRKSASKSGLNKRVEGVPGRAPVVLVDDVLHSGLSFESACLALAELDVDLAGCFAIVDFRSPSGMAWRKRIGAPVRSIFELAEFDLALANGSRTVESTAGAFELVWEYRHPVVADLGSVTARSTPAIVRDMVMFGTSSGDLVCLSASTGAPLWRRANDASSFKGVRSSPTASGKTVFYGGYDGNLYALRVETGETVWVSRCAEYIGSSPAIVSDLGLLLVGLEREVPGRRGALAALDLSTGRVVWEVETERYLHGTPVVCGERGLVLVGTNDGTVLCVEAKDGRVVWRCLIGGDVKGAPAIDAGRDLACVAATDGGFYGLSLTDGSIGFVLRAESSIETTPLLVGARAFVPSTDKYLYVFDLDQKRCVARLRSRARSFSAPSLADGGVVFGNNAGLIFDIDPDSLALRARHQVTDRVAAGIAFDETRRLYFVHTFEDRLIALRRVPAAGGAA
jgi:outer membrane protein assembly factor BamB/orotate phosphoribosyltransferase